MKAARFTRFGGPEVLEIAELPAPRPGAGQIRIAVRAAGVNPTDAKARQGLVDEDLPQTTGRDVAGVVDELGEGVTGVHVGDAVFGFSDDGAGAAELALVTHFAPIPASLDFAAAAALPVVVETATRGLDALAVGAGTVLLVNGASNGIGSAAVQLALARGARVIGVARAGGLEQVRSLGADPIEGGEGFDRRVLALAPDGVDRALDIAGNGVLPELIRLAGGAVHVVTIADFAGARSTGVRFSTGEDGRAFGALASIGALVEAGRFSLPVVATLPLERIAEAHRLVEQGGLRGKVVLTV